MRVLIMGIGDAFTSRYFGSSALIEAPEGFVLIDCPDLVLRAMHEATTAAGWSVGATDIGDVILTHLHGDHCNGLESFGFTRRRLRLENPDLPRPRLHTSPGAAARLWERLAPAMDSPFDGRYASTLEDYFDVHLMDPDTPSETCVAGLRVRCRRTLHPIPTIGLRITDGQFTLGWSGDTAYDDAHVEWLRDADLIVHETSPGVVHTPIEKLNALPDELRNKMRLIHLADEFDPGVTDIVPLRQGEVLVVG